MRLIIPVLVFTGVTLSATATMKQPAAKVIIDRGDLAGLVEIVDRPTLDLSNVYTGNFVDSARGSAPVPAGLPQYEVSFYLPDLRGNTLTRFFQRPRLYRAYVVSFAPDTARHTGYVYLPGQTDTWSSWNHGTIIRGNLEGHWSYASPAWAQRLSDRITHARKRPEPTCPPDSRMQLRQGDSAYSDVAELLPVLEDSHLRVLCIYHSTMDGLLGQSHSAVILTNLGPFEAVFFSAPRGAEAVIPQSTVRDGQLLTVLHGPLQVRPTDSLYSADKSDFVIHKRWLFDTFGQVQLHDALERAVAGR